MALGWCLVSVLLWRLFDELILINVPWSAMKCPVMSFEISVNLVRLWAACILKLRAMFLHCWRICMVCLALDLVGSWVDLGFSVSMEAFG